MRGDILNHTVPLVTEDCIDCGVIFAMPKDLRDRLVQTRRTFYCPNGHQMSFTGKTDAQKLREAEAKLETERQRARTREQALRDQAKAAERRRAAAQGQVTKIKKRTAKGVCPVPGCKRSFVNVAAHVNTQHPSWALDEHQHAEAR